MSKYTATIVTIVLCVITAIALVVSANVGLARHEVSRTDTPDITIAPCSMSHIPANTLTDVCVDASGHVVPRTH